MIEKDYYGIVKLSGCVADLTQADKRRLFARHSSSESEVTATVAGILEAVRVGGDSELRSLAKHFDMVELSSLEVPAARCKAALEAMDSPLRDALERAISNISNAQKASFPSISETSPEPGIRVGRRPDPLTKVGIYAPGGRASYPSSVLMGAVPAKVAGVGEIVLCSPPGLVGFPPPTVLAAATLSGVDRVFAIGGAGAIAAMAYGTDTVPRVDKIVGPGNAYVAEAKLQVSRDTAIDSPAGPSELFVIADSSANPDTIAREMIAQAEHDPAAIVITVTIGAEIAAAILQSLAAMLPFQTRGAIVAESLATRGAVLEAANIGEAIELSNAFSPEHLMLAIADPLSILARIQNAGTVFLGQSSSVSFGDYMTGANHVLPTGGLARSYSGLSVLDFIRWTTYQSVTPDAARSLANDVAIFAEAESLQGHAAAARAWAAAGA